MMTKAEEREVLKKIQKLIESTGKGSYLDMTFAGIIEQAEENDNIETIYLTKNKQFYGALTLRDLLIAKKE